MVAGHNDDPTLVPCGFERVVQSSCLALGKGTPVTAAKILQPKDTHVFSVEGGYAVTGVGGFKSTSEHLSITDNNFSRGPSVFSSYFVPTRLMCKSVVIRTSQRSSLETQTRSTGMRLDSLDPEGRTTQNTIYYHSARKESSLADVDNEVTAVVRKFTKSHVEPVSRANTIIAPRPNAHT